MRWEQEGKAQTEFFWCPGDGAWHTEFLLQGAQNGSGAVKTVGKVVLVCHSGLTSLNTPGSSTDMEKYPQKAYEVADTGRGPREGRDIEGKNHNYHVLTVAEDFFSNVFGTIC